MESIKSTDFSIRMNELEIGKARIKVIGVGGGGNNAIDTMIASGMKNVGFIAANTDTQVLDDNLAETKLTLGAGTTAGLGAGANPRVGYKAAEESREQIKEVLQDTDMLFITAGMGGGTGTGASPIIANIARDMGILTVAVVTTPFKWEELRRAQVARMGIQKLSKIVDSLIVIPNDKLLDQLENEPTFSEAMKLVDEVLYNATRGITDIIFDRSFINTDFADVKAVMQQSGKALMGIGSAAGENRAEEAALNALNSPFLNDVTIEGAKGLLVKIAANDLKMDDVNRAMSTIRTVTGHSVEIEDFDFEDFDDDANYDLDFDDFDEIEGPNVIFGASQNGVTEGKLQVTIIATGISRARNQQNKKGMLVNPITEDKPIAETQGKTEVVSVEPELVVEEVAKVEEVETQANSQEYVVAPSNPFKRVINMQNFNVPRGTDALASFDAPASSRRNGMIKKGMLSNN